MAKLNLNVADFGTPIGDRVQLVATAVPSPFVGSNYAETHLDENGDASFADVEPGYYSVDIAGLPVATVHVLESDGDAELAVKDCLISDYGALGASRD